MLEIRSLDSLFHSWSTSVLRSITFRQCQHMERHWVQSATRTVSLTFLSLFLIQVCTYLLPLTFQTNPKTAAKFTYNFWCCFDKRCCLFWTVNYYITESTVRKRQSSVGSTSWIIVSKLCGCLMISRDVTEPAKIRIQRADFVCRMSEADADLSRDQN